jgi:hypothetical protein
MESLFAYYSLLSLAFQSYVKFEHRRSGIKRIVHFA